jgi:hypothetical protein
MIIRVEDLIYKEDTRYPEYPARTVCNGAQDPVTETPGASGFWNFATLQINSVQQNTT